MSLLTIASTRLGYCHGSCDSLRSFRKIRAKYASRVKRMLEGRASRAEGIMEITVCTKRNASHGFGLSERSKIVIIGTSGSGKSTLAKYLSKKLGIKDIELDSLFWKENWQQAKDEDFRKNIKISLENVSGFVIHGNYNNVRNLTWANSEILIWLDYSREIIMFRIITRTLKRILTRKKLWNGNIETIKNSMFSKDSIIFWAWKTYNLRRKQYSRLKSENVFGIKRMIIIKKPTDVKYLMQSSK